MPEKSNFRTKYLCGEVYVEAVVMPGVDGDMELQHIQEVSIMIGSGENAVSFVLPYVVEAMLEAHKNKLVEIIKKQDKQEESDDTRS